LPPAELRVEEKVPEVYRDRILRITGDVADLDAAKDVEPLLASRGISSAIVIAKHLCGVGTDLALKLVHRWRAGQCEEASVSAPSAAPAPAPAQATLSEGLPLQPSSYNGPAAGCDELAEPLSRWQQVSQAAPAGQVESACSARGSDSNRAGSGGQVALLGAIFATCCGHKIGGADRELYAAMHHQDSYLHGLTLGDSERLLQLLALCTRCISWRTTAGANANRILPSQVRAAELFEDALQQPRLNLLRRLFPAAQEVAFIDAARSPQNRCLVAGTEEGVAMASGTDCEEGAMAALRAARDELHAQAGGPLDLKPRGFVSKKYAYDGT